MPNESSKKQNEVNITCNGCLPLTLLTTFVDLVLALMHRDLLIPLALIEDLSRCGISIVNADDTMAPSCAHQSLSLAKETLLLLVVTNLSELVPESFNFFASFFGRA